jgi:hypothetical protein
MPVSQAFGSSATPGTRHGGARLAHAYEGFKKRNPDSAPVSAAQARGHTGAFLLPFTSALTRQKQLPLPLENLGLDGFGCRTAPCALVRLVFPHVGQDPARTLFGKSTAACACGTRRTPGGAPSSAGDHS